jgi:hypothetical protein
MGDFISVHCSALDRRHVPKPNQQLLQPPAMQQQLLRAQQQHGGDMPQPQPHQLCRAPSATRDTAPAAAWAAHLPGVKDAWRERHPQRRAFTYGHPCAASRLDRVHVSSSLLPQVAACRLEECQPSLSDHIQVVLQLLPHGPGVMGPGLRRLRLTCQSDTYCPQQLATWLSTQQVPQDPVAVVEQWWPAFKHILRLKVQGLTCVARARHAEQGLEAQRATAAAGVMAAHAHVERCVEAGLPAASHR